MDNSGAVSRYNRAVFLGVSLLLSSVLAAFAWQYYTSQRYESLFNDSVMLESTISDTSFHFKSQVQEWKNVLLRGHHPADEQRYWMQFLQEEQRVLTLLQSLDNVTVPTEVRANLTLIAQKHRQLSQLYRKAYIVFIDQDYDATAADRSVLGIDRSIGDLLQQSAAILRRDVAARHDDFEKRSLQLTLVAIALVLLIFILTIVILKKIINDAVMTEIRGRTKSDFLAKMSHEIRTPMNGVLGMAELLSASDLDKTQARYNSAIVSSANALLSIINDILDFSKIEAGMLELDEQAYEPRLLMEDVYFVFAFDAKKKGIELIFDVADDVPKTLLGDKNRLRQVLLNLLSNALKFTLNGHIRLTMQLADGHLRQLLIKIIDTGIGMSDVQQTRVFQPFVQAEVSTSGEFGGTGLGLAIVKELIGKMDGDINLLSVQSQGTTFTIRLPLQEVNHGELHTEILTGKRIAFVEDSAALAEIYEQKFRLWEMQVTSFIDPLKALEYFQSSTEALDIISLDLHMPELSGLALATEIRKQPLFASTPILLLTATGEIPAQALLNKHGISYAEEKPALPYHIQSLIKALIDGRDIVQGARKVVKQAKQTFTILVAEDDAVNRLVIKGMLQQLGQQFTLVEDGSQAWECFQQSVRGFDVILMDCEMPVMGGLEATSLIRQLEAEEERDHAVFIVALTAHTGAKEAQRCYECGMNVVLTKPISQKTLRDMLNQISDE